MPTFQCAETVPLPTDYIGGPDRFFPSPQPLRTLMGRFLPNRQAVNVFKLVAGGYTTQQPYEGEPGSVISYTYLGSHTYTISQAEADALTAAGFGAGVSP